MNKAEEVVVGFEKASADRSIVEGLWSDVLYYVVPRKRDITSKVEGKRTPSDVFDTTAIRANRIFAAGMSGYMTNASQRWFEMRTKDEKLMDDMEIRRYFSAVQEIMYSSLAHSNFYQQINEVYMDLGAIGNACLYEEDDHKTDIRFFARHMREIYFVENEREEVDIVYRLFEFTAIQAMKFFGAEYVNEGIKKAIENKDYKKNFEFIHYVGPRHIRDVSKEDNKNMPFESIWVCKADKSIAKEGGYLEMRYFVTRLYKNSGETTGYSPGIDVLPDILMINKLAELLIEAAEIGMYPPYLLQHDGMISSLDLRSGALNYQRDPIRTDGKAIEQMKVDNRVDFGIELYDRIKKTIEAAFFVDLFLMIANSVDMTATEVMARAQERMLILGPAIGQLQSELLNPVIYTTYAILGRRGKLPPIPQALMDVEYEVVYVGPLAKAQRALQANDITSFLAIIGEMAAFAPDVLDTVDTDKAVEKIAKAKNVDADVIRDTKVIKKIRDDRAKAAQKMEMLQMMINSTKAAQQAGGAAKSRAEASAISKQ